MSRRRSRRSCRRLRGSRGLRRHYYWNRSARRWLGNRRTWRGSNLCGLGGRDDHRLWNHGRRSRRCGLCLNGAYRRHGRSARLGNNRSGWWWRHGRRRWRGYNGGLEASRPGGGFFGSLVRYRFLFRFCFRVGECAKVVAHLHRGFYFNRTGMRLFLGNSGFGQIVNNGFCLDLEFASQFVDSDLIRIGHCPPGRLLFSVLF
jgi:hypothetical protein